MVDRLKIEDDSRNKVNMAKNQVALSKNFLKRCENGQYVGRLLTEMYPTFSNRSDKTFTIPPAVTDLTDEVPTYNPTVWKNLFEVLAQFGCKLDPSKQDVILKTTKQESVIDILDCLFEIDNSATGQISANTKRKLGIKGAAKPPKQNNLEQMSEISKDNDQYLAKNIKNSLTERKGSAALTRSKKLQPINDGKSPRRDSSPQSPKQPDMLLRKNPSLGSLMSPKGKTPSRILGKESSLLMDISIGQLEEVMPSSLEACRTSFQFILMSLAMGFDMKPKQAAALLTNNNKFLAHLCVKGAKGGDFEKVKKWYEIVQPMAGLLVNLINTEKKDVLSYQTPLSPIQSKVTDAKQNRGKILIKTLNILKSGFYSRDQDVQVLCCFVFQGILSEINDSVSDMQTDVWEWLTTQTVQPEWKRSQNVGGSVRESKQQIGAHLRKDKSERNELESEMKQAAGNNKELDSIQLQTGIQALIFAYQTNDILLDSMTSVILRCAQMKPQEFFNFQLQQQAQTWSIYGNLCQDIFRKSLGTQEAAMIIENSGVLNFWIVQSLKIAESNSEVPLNDRIVSLVFMTEIWLSRPRYFDGAVNGTPDAIMKILKKGARDVRRTLCIISIELMFRLLSNFASQKHSFAPTIYKTLTFLLVEFYWEVDVRDLMLRHFIELFANFESIPINILCEPLLKQIEISQYHAASFNVFDFEFFTVVSAHRKLNFPTALLVIDSLSKIALTSVFYQKPAIKIISDLMTRFQNYPELIDHWKDSFRTILQTVVNIEARFAVHRHHLRQEEANFFNRLALRNKKSKVEVDPTGGRLSDQEYTQVKVNERLAINLLENVYQMQNHEINQELKTQLTDTYISIQQSLKIDCKAISYLLRYFSKKLDTLVEDRLNQNPQVLQLSQVPYVQELNQLQGRNNLSHSPSRRSIDIYKPKTSPKNEHSQSKIPTLAVGLPSHDPNRLQQVSVALPLNQPEQKRHIQRTSQLYDYEKWEEEWEIKQYQQFLKLHKKLYKELHKSYINENAVKKYLSVKRTTFEENEKTVDQITAISLVKMLKDFRLENGMSPPILKEEVIKLVKQINLLILQQPGDIQTLNFDGFVHFMLQYAYFNWQQEKDHKAYQLIERLFNLMRESDKFKKLNLVMSKIETTDRKEGQVLQILSEKYQENDEYQNKNFKVQENVVKSVQYLVPDVIPFPEEKKIVIEVLDQILADRLGFHFLEPITVEQNFKKVIPQLISRRKVSVPPVIVQTANRGINSNLPLSQAPKISSEQMEARERFLQVHNERLQQRRDTTQNQDDNFNDPKEQFKAQAINRRAAKFGHAIQMTVVDADTLEQKQQLFECAEVLVEVLNAVEQGKKALRLDFTPYKLYELRKKKSVERVETITEQPMSEDPEQRDRKRQAVNEFMERHKNYLEQQKIKKTEEEEQKKAEAQRLENKKKKQLDEYAAMAGEQKEMVNAKRLQKFQQKAEEQQNAREEKKRKAAEANEQLQHRLEKNQDHIRQLEEEKQGQLQQRDHKEEKQNAKQKNLAEKWSTIHKDKMSQNQQIKQEQRDSFFEFIKNMGSLLNQKYRKGLYIKFEQCLKISQKTSGVTQSGWIDWMKQNGVNSKINIKLLISIHTAQIKEMEEVSDYSTMVQDDAKTAGAIPGEKELSYPGFVLALVKVANIGKLKFRGGEEQSQSQQKQKNDYEEYSLEDFSEQDVENFFKFMKVAEKKDK